ncbi:50S ribosomal protein L29 [Candidatus Symbiobacter mobilis]|uniref:Large ribosomal subunit protein uL29 n=1 Tax=Candidatus Symbiobacter mobilis CR TaxID=946483 RepID=U5N592_9BURK|nr:50S ribosomal protein L29 [Candidatus Symbiobacter mobilis]AGX86517.1 hypothetical protein Cenrod_0394 [Candidatus Symbiobacter mobilis CR]
MEIKTNQLTTLRAMDIEGLRKEIRERQKAYFSLRMTRKTDVQFSVHQLRMARRGIAVAKTILVEKLRSSLTA